MIKRLFCPGTLLILLLVFFVYYKQEDNRRIELCLRSLDDAFSEYMDAKRGTSNYYSLETAVGILQRYRENCRDNKFNNLIEGGNNGK